MTVVEAKIDQVGELLLNLSQETGLNIPQITDELMELLLRSGDNTPYAAFFNNGDVAKITNFAGDLKAGGAELVRGMAGDVGFFRAWEVLNETDIEGLATKIENLEIVDVFVKKYPEKVDDLKTTLKEAFDPEGILQSVKRFDEVSYIENTNDLIKVLENVTDVNTVTQLETKGIGSFFRGTTRSKTTGSLFPGNPNSQLGGISTSTDPIRATIFAIESATSNPDFRGILQMGLPSDLGDMRLLSPNNRVAIELEAILKTSADDFSNLAKIEITVDDARTLVKEVFDIDLPSTISSQAISTELLESLDISSLENALEFYQKGIQYNTK